MKRSIIIFFLLGSLLGACMGSSPTVEDVQRLTVGDGTEQKMYSVAELKELAPSESDFNGVGYIGVPLTELLIDAGFDPQAIQVVKVSASDGYSINYDSDLFMREDVLVAYAQVDGDLTEDDGTFRMVLPGEEGKLNLRMLVEIKVILE